jgi:pimeloyl-ACP methyl ester carboxylesterase
VYDLTLMTGVGHYLMLEDPKRFSELLADAVARLVSPSS